MFFFSFLAGFLGWIGGGNSGVIPLPEGLRLQVDIQVWDEQNRSFILREILPLGGSAGPLVLLPLYTACPQVCPILTQKLKGVLLQSPWKDEPKRIVALSFNPRETPEQLKKYRQQQEVPASWVILRSDLEGIRTLFDALQYRVMTSKGELVHPTQIFFFDEQGRAQAALKGIEWSVNDLNEALDRAKNPTLTQWKNPERLAWGGFVGMCLSLLFLFGYKIQKARRKSS